MIGKLQMTAGDLAKAKETFTSITAEKSAVKPAPRLLKCNESLYFRRCAIS